MSLEVHQYTAHVVTLEKDVVVDHEGYAARLTPHPLHMFGILFRNIYGLFSWIMPLSAKCWIPHTSPLSSSMYTGSCTGEPLFGEKVNIAIRVEGCNVKGITMRLMRLQ
ncbi:hypothetical protein ACJMK2_044700 [Sinanodonta woodiana]|uniref:Uncharacterized protein n=1 Tax=Sinanodonta woodiana TaxID=1069815 RepID=A0ABD3W0U4_SINWO